MHDPAFEEESDWKCKGNIVETVVSSVNSAAVKAGKANARDLLSFDRQKKTYCSCSQETADSFNTIYDVTCSIKDRMTPQMLSS